MEHSLQLFKIFLSENRINSGCLAVRTPERVQVGDSLFVHYEFLEKLSVFGGSSSDDIPIIATSAAVYHCF